MTENKGMTELEKMQKKLDDWQAGFQHFLSTNLELTQKIIAGHVEQTKKEERAKMREVVEGAEPPTRFLHISRSLQDCWLTGKEDMKQAILKALGK